MSNKTLASRIFRVIGETLDFYIALKDEQAALRDDAPTKPNSSFGGSYGKTVALGRRKRRSQKVSARPDQLSPAEDTQNIMNGLLARVVGNTERDGS